MKKADRQAFIKQLIGEHDIETQDDLIEMLESKGIRATQATISRDIRELSIVKTHGGDGRVKYAIFTPNTATNEEKLREVIQDSVLKITKVQFINIIHTSLGTANVVAAVIDDMGSPEIVGTLAGTDTLVIYSPNELAATVVYDRIQSLIL